MHTSSGEDWAGAHNKEVGFIRRGRLVPRAGIACLLGAKLSLPPCGPGAPKSFPQGISGLQHASRCKGLEIGFGSLLLALSSLCGELKTAHLQVCPRSVVNQAVTVQDPASARISSPSRRAPASSLCEISPLCVIKFVINTLTKHCQQLMGAGGEGHRWSFREGN